MLIYNKLWKLLKERGMKRTDLKCVISTPTIAKLGKNEIVSSEVIAKVCDYLKCQPSDMMENIPQEEINRVENEINNTLDVIAEAIAKERGLNKELVKEELLRQGKIAYESLEKASILNE